MKNQKLIHDRAEAMAFDLLATVSNCLREEEWQDAFAEFYAITAAGLKGYDRQAARMRRFGGSVNRAEEESPAGGIRAVGRSAALTDHTPTGHR